MFQGLKVEDWQQHCLGENREVLATERKQIVLLGTVVVTNYEQSDPLFAL